MDDDALGPLLQRARAAHGPALALDLRLGTAHGPSGERPACVLVALVTGVPSGDDSRYRVEHLGTLPAATAAQTDASLATARALAAHLGVTLHPADGARTWEDPSWIALQGPAPERPWAVQWQVVTWGEDGAELRASGDASVSAPSGRAACAQVEQDLSRRFAPPYDREVQVSGLAHPVRMAFAGPYPDALPPAAALHASALAGHRPAELLRALEAAPVRERMVALGIAFSLDLRALGPVRLRAEGALTDDALDAALAPLLEQTRPRWSLPLLLRREHAAGRSTGPLLRAFYEQHRLGVIGLIIAMREAFGLSLAAAKHLVANCACSGAQDAALDAALAAELGARPG